jgi:CBS domain containing-hemolysin-like protein
MRYILKIKEEMQSGEQVFGKLDLNHLVRQGDAENEKEREEIKDIKIFKNALDLSELKVRDCMRPRTEIVAHEIETPIDKLLESFTESGLSRIIVFRENIDNVIGYINSKDMFRNPEHIGEHLKSLPIVPETLPVNKILRSFIKDGKSIALVLDEFGGTSGIITTEDVIEEIFGEIQDEHDVTELIEQEITPGSYRFSGRLEIDYLNEKYNMQIPESEEYDTLAGFIIYHFENIPKVNETIVIESFHIRVIKVSANKIDLVEFSVLD